MTVLYWATVTVKRVSVTLFVFVAGLLLVAQAAVGAHSTDAAASKGALALRVLGLPPGEDAALTVLGPPQSRGAERLRRVVAVFEHGEPEVGSW